MYAIFKALNKVETIYWWPTCEWTLKLNKLARVGNWHTELSKAPDTKDESDFKEKRKSERRLNKYKGRYGSFDDVGDVMRIMVGNNMFVSVTRQGLISVSAVSVRLRF